MANNIENAEKFTSNMIAPCGLNCTLCHRALFSENSCGGCRGPEERKGNHCKNVCTIVRCNKLLQGEFDFCDKCENYPCEEVMEKEIRYTSAYPLRESPVENLKYIRKFGMNAYLKSARKEWICSKCGGILCVQTGKCHLCGE